MFHHKKNILNFRHLKCQKMSSMGFIYEFYNPINCPSIHKYHGISYSKVELGLKKSLLLLPSLSSPSNTLMQVFGFDFLQLKLPNKLHCFAIPRSVQDIISLLVILCIFQQGYFSGIHIYFHQEVLGFGLQPHVVNFVGKFAIGVSKFKW